MLHSTLGFATVYDQSHTETEFFEAKLTLKLRNLEKFVKIWEFAEITRKRSLNRDFADNF